jgi:hypothetical protein
MATTPTAFDPSEILRERTPEEAAEAEGAAKAGEALRTAAAQLLAVAAHHPSLLAHAVATGDAERTESLIGAAVKAIGSLHAQAERMERDAQWAGEVVDWINKYGLEGAPEAVERITGAKLTPGQVSLIQKIDRDSTSRDSKGARVVAALLDLSERAVYKARVRFDPDDDDPPRSRSARDKARQLRRLFTAMHGADPAAPVTRHSILHFVIVDLFGYTPAEAEAALRPLGLDEDTLRAQASDE